MDAGDPVDGHPVRDGDARVGGGGRGDDLDLRVLVSEDRDEVVELGLQGLDRGAVEVPVDGQVLCDPGGSLDAEGRVGGHNGDVGGRDDEGFLDLEALLGEDVAVDSEFGCEWECGDVGGGGEGADLDLLVVVDAHGLDGVVEVVGRIQRIGRGGVKDELASRRRVSRGGVKGCGDGLDLGQDHFIGIREGGGIVRAPLEEDSGPGRELLGVSVAEDEMGLVGLVADEGSRSGGGPFVGFVLAPRQEDVPLVRDGEERVDDLSSLRRGRGDGVGG